MPFGVTFGDEIIMAGLGGLPLSWLEGGDTVQGREDLDIGSLRALDKVILAHDPARVPAPEVLPPRMFYNALAGKAYITEAEALAAMEGATPQILVDAIATFDPAIQYQVNMILTGGINLERFPPLSDVIKQAFTLDDNGVYDLWSYGWTLG